MQIQSLNKRQETGDKKQDNGNSYGINLIIGIKGAGEMATGVACCLFNSNFTRIFMMEIDNPLAVRRKVSFCEAVHDGSAIVEGIRAVKVEHSADFVGTWDKKLIPVLVDPQWESIRALTPHVVIDAILAKKNLGTTMSEAPLVIGLGPGFTAGEDVHMAIETNRGHNLGRIILKGSPEPNTGIPGTISGFNLERVLRAPCQGVFRPGKKIGDMVKTGELIGRINEEPVLTRIDGVLRGLIRPGSKVKSGLKIGDVDPRGKAEYCSSISEKARAIGGSVLAAILRQYNQ